MEDVTNVEKTYRSPDFGGLPEAAKKRELASAHMADVRQGRKLKGRLVEPSDGQEHVVPLGVVQARHSPSVERPADAERPKVRRGLGRGLGRGARRRGGRMATIVRPRPINATALEHPDWHCPGCRSGGMISEWVLSEDGELYSRLFCSRELPGPCGFALEGQALESAERLWQRLVVNTVRVNLACPAHHAFSLAFTGIREDQVFVECAHTDARLTGEPRKAVGGRFAPRGEHTGPLTLTDVIEGECCEHVNLTMPLASLGLDQTAAELAVEEGSRVTQISPKIAEEIKTTIRKSSQGTTENLDEPLVESDAEAIRKPVPARLKVRAPAQAKAQAQEHGRMLAELVRSKRNASKVAVFDCLAFLEHNGDGEMLFEGEDGEVRLTTERASRCATAQRVAEVCGLSQAKVGHVLSRAVEWKYVGKFGPFCVESGSGGRRLGYRLSPKGRMWLAGRLHALELARQGASYRGVLPMVDASWMPLSNGADGSR